MICSSNPNSELNAKRRSVHISKDILRLANMGYGSKSIAMSLLNRSMKELRHFVKGEPVKVTPDFESEIQGIPCGIKITHYQPAEPMVWGQAMEDSDPGCPAQIEFDVYDRKGYRANWLQNKLTDADIDRIEGEWLEIVRIGAQ